MVDFKVDCDLNDPLQVETVARFVAQCIVPSIRSDIPEKIYHALPLPSAHKLMAFRDHSPYKYWDSYLNPENKPEPQKTSPQMLLGQAFHALVLEPERAVRDVRCLPDIDLRTKAGKEEMKKIQEGEGPTSILLKEDDYLKVHAMEKSFFEDKDNKAMFWGGSESGENERSIFWKERGIFCRGRVDRIVDNQILDLKTTSNLNYYKFGNDAEAYGYIWQLAIYRRALKWLRPESSIVTPCMVVIETERPFASVCVTPQEYDLDAEEFEFEQVMTIFAHCVKNKTWPKMPREMPLFRRANSENRYRWYSRLVGEIESTPQKQHDDMESFEYGAPI